LALAKMLCESFVEGLDIDEFLVTDAGTSKLPRKRFERADDRNDTVDLCLHDRVEDRTVACKWSRAPVRHEQSERLANGCTRHAESSAQAPYRKLRVRTKLPGSDHVAYAPCELPGADLVGRLALARPRPRRGSTRKRNDDVSDAHDP